MRLTLIFLLWFIFYSEIIASAQNKESYYASRINDTAKISGYVIIPKGKSYMLFIPDVYLEKRSIPDYIDWYNKSETSALVDTNIFVFVLDRPEYNFFRTSQLLRTTNDSTLFPDYYDVNKSVKDLIVNTDFTIGRVNNRAYNNTVYKDKRNKNRYFEIYRIDEAYWKRYVFSSKSLDIQLPYNIISPDLTKKYINLYVLIPNPQNYFYPCLDLKIRKFKLIKML